MKIINIFRQVKYYLKNYGIKKTIRKIISKIFVPQNVQSERQKYQTWILNNEPTKEELEEQRKTKFSFEPKFSIVVPMYNTPSKFLEELVDCFINQTYSNWELCFADGSPKENEELKPILSKDKRIKYKFLNENKGISGNTNEALKLATGDFIALVDHDDLVPTFCLYELAKTINENPEVEFIYTDEDKIEGTKDKRCDPHFKPDFSIDALRANNYITHLSVFKKELMEKLGGFREAYNGAQDFDIIIRAAENTSHIIHIPKVLYHWRVHQNSTAMASSAKPYAYEAGLRVIEDHLKRQNLKAKVTNGGDIPGVYQVEYEVEGKPKVSIVIPNKDSIKLLKKCITSILKLTTYENYEIVIIENNSEDEKTFEYYKEIQKLEKVKVIYYPEKGFNYSKIINFGVKNCEDSEFILQLNSDTELLTPNWLEKFIGFAQRKDIGAVGARLYYEDKSIQHAGIGIGICDLAANLLTNTPQYAHAYFGRECLTRNVSAVTGACLFARREIYEEVGYMDEENFAVALNDVDFCLKIREKGYLIVYNPYIELMHFESKTRGYEDTKEKKERFEKECNNFRTKWREVLDEGDPYSNINFAQDNAQYTIRVDKIKK